MEEERVEYRRGYLSSDVLILIIHFFKLSTMRPTLLFKKVAPTLPTITPTPSHFYTE